MYAALMNLSFLICLLFAQATAAPKSPQRVNWNWKGSEHAPMLPLRTARMSAKEKTAIQKAIAAEINGDSGAESESKSADMTLNAAVEIVHLSDTRIEDFVADFPETCSPTGNCDMLFFARTAQGYKLVIESEGQNFAIEKTGTNGFRDVIVQMQGTSIDSELELYHYARGKYRLVGCYDANSAPIVNGVRRELKEPQITPEACDPE